MRLRLHHPSQASKMKYISKLYQPQRSDNYTSSLMGERYCFPELRGMYHKMFHDVSERFHVFLQKLCDEWSEGVRLLKWKIELIKAHQLEVSLDRIASRYIHICLDHSRLTCLNISMVLQIFPLVYLLLLLMVGFHTSPAQTYRNVHRLFS